MSSTYRTGTAGESLQLRYSTDRALSGLFVQCKIYDSSDVLKYTVNLTESLVFAGRYVGSVTITTEGDYEAFYVPYSDSGHTVESDTAPRSSEAIRITITQSNFGGATLPPSGGITDNDIAEIIAGVNKSIGYQNPWDHELSNGKTAGEELMSKSEFNHKKDEVVIPKIDINKLTNSIVDLVNEKFGETQKSLNNILMEISKVRMSKESNMQPFINTMNKILGILNQMDLKSLESKMSDLDSSLYLNSKKDKKEGKDSKNLLDILGKLSKLLNDNKEMLIKQDELQLSRLNKLYDFVKDQFVNLNINKEAQTQRMISGMLRLMENYENEN